MSPDKLINAFDKTLRIFSGISSAHRPYPSATLAIGALSEADRRHSAGLMRINHVGEVCAQALYQAQSRFARNEATRQQFVMAGQEEMDHLGWTAERLKELGARASLLNPIWYAGSYAMGAIAAQMGDAYSLGFVVETERQVEAHLDSHLSLLPAEDGRSRAIVAQMRDDEIAHGAAAAELGAAELPAPIKLGMTCISKLMTKTAYYI
jgi:ubiquinone biosynthesis monooxygenase Coq7